MNNLAKLTDNQIAKEERKLNDPGAVEIAKKDITARLRNLKVKKAPDLKLLVQPKMHSVVR